MRRCEKLEGLSLPASKSGGATAPPAPPSPTPLIRDEADPDLSASPSQHKPSNRDPLQSLAARVASKLEEGDFRGAIRLASSEDTIAELNDRTLTALKVKHPPPHPDSNILTAPSEENSTPIKVSVEEVSKAIHSFACGSAGGPDGLRPQHLKDMTSTSAEGGDPLLLEALTAFVNLVLEGKTPAPVRPFFFGASLVALDKKDGGVRLIAVGWSLRCLVAKSAGNCVMETMRAFLALFQLGYGTPHGSEAAAHAACIYLQNLPSDHLLLKLDLQLTISPVQ